MVDLGSRANISYCWPWIQDQMQTGYEADPDHDRVWNCHTIV